MPNGTFHIATKPLLYKVGKHVEDDVIKKRVPSQLVLLIRA
jgi:hypothetical protein